MKRLNVPFAVNKDQQLIAPTEAIKGETYYCPACGDTLTLRQGQVRIFHFSHRTTNVCTQETIIHQTAKKLICKTIDDWKNHGGPLPIVIRNCPKCRNEKKQPLPDKVEEAKEEFPIGNFRGDVVIFANGLPAAIVEVFVTHAVEEKKSKNLPIPFIEVDGEEIIRDPINWKPIVDKFKPLICEPCLEQERVNREKCERVSRKTGIPLPSKYYIPGIVECWKCKKEILVFSWPDHDSYGKKPPKEQPIPKTIKYQYTKTANDSYWVNTCPYCHGTQGDFFLYCEPDGPFFGQQSEDDFEEWT